MALLGTAPLDFLSHRLQHLDATRGSLSELLDNRSSGLLRTVQRRFWKLLNPDGHHGELYTLEWWATYDLSDIGRSTVVGLAAAVWVRLILK